MKQKINKKISLKKEIWYEIREKMKKIKEDINYSEISGNVKIIRYQGSVATKTIINPKISKGRNDIDLDVAIIINSDRNENYKEIVKECKEQLSKVFPSLKINQEEKAFGISFPSFSVDDEVINLSLDFVILFSINEETYVWNHKNETLEYSDPFSMIDEFNKIEPEERYFVNVLKALVKANKIKGVNSIFIINSALSIKNNGVKITFDNLIYQLKKDMKDIVESGFIKSCTNPNDKLSAMKNEEYELRDIIVFLDRVNSMTEDQIIEIIDLSLRNNTEKINLQKPNKMTNAVHCSNKKND